MTSELEEAIADLQRIKRYIRNLNVYLETELQEVKGSWWKAHWQPSTYRK